MSDHRSIRRRNPGLLIFCGLLAIYYLPVLTPVRRVSSESYVFHYNNRVATLLIAALLAAVAWYVRRTQLQLPPSQHVFSPVPAATRPLLLALSAMLAAALALWWLAAPWGGFYESAYFIDRLQLLLAGRHIYTGFEFIYGPLMLYGPAWFCRLFGLSAANGYYLFWTLTLLAGTVLLWQMVQRFELDAIAISAATRTRIFLFLIFFQLLQVPTMGLNYSVLRVVLPYFFLLLLYRYARAGRQAAVLATAVSGLALLLASSPEQGFAFSFAVLLYLPLSRWARRQRVPGAWLLLLPVFALEFVLAARAGIFITLRTFSAGGDCFPIYLNPFTLLIFAVLLLVAVYVGSAPLRERLLPNSALLLLYICAALPAMFGRCDPLHMMDNGLAAFVCAFLLIRQWPRAWRCGVLIYAVLFMAFPLATLQEWPLFGRATLAHIWMNDGPHGAIERYADDALTRFTIHHYGESAGRSKLALLRASFGVKAAAGQGALAGATPVVEAPFLYVPNTLGIYEGPLADSGYFSGITDVFTEQQVSRKISELQAHPDRDVLVRWEAPQLCNENIAMAGKGMRVVFMTPVLLPGRHDNDLLQPLCSYIQTNYSLVHPSSPETSGYSLWHPNASASQRSP